MTSSASPFVPAPSRPRRVLALGVAVAAALAGPLVVATPASAHDYLVSSDPAADSAVETLPEQLVLVYSAELLDVGDGTAVEVEAPSGASVTDGAPVLDGTDVTVPLAEGTEAGEYTVTWRVVSSDGHPIDGVFGFTVENAVPLEEETSAPTPTPTESPSPDAEEPSTDDAEDQGPDPEPADGETDTEGTSSLLPWILAGTALLIAVVALVVALMARRRGGDAAGDGEEERAEGDTRDGDDAPRER